MRMSVDSEICSVLPHRNSELITKLCSYKIVLSVPLRVIIYVIIIIQFQISLFGTSEN
jgi:hypothetical protein